MTTTQKTKPAEQHAPFDIHLLPKVEGADYQPGDLLRRMPAPARALISTGCVSVFYSHPGARKADCDRLAFEVWDHVRSQVYDEQGHTCESALQAAGLSPTAEIERVLRLLLASGDLRATLLRQRAQIDAVLQQLGWCEEIAR